VTFLTFASTLRWLRGARLDFIPCPHLLPVANSYRPMLGWIREGFARRFNTGPAERLRNLKLAEVSLMLCVREVTR